MKKPASYYGEGMKAKKRNSKTQARKGWTQQNMTKKHGQRKGTALKRTSRRGA